MMNNAIQTFVLNQALTSRAWWWWAAI